MIKLIIDSASDITKEEADKLGITMVSMQIQFEDKEYLDGVDLLPEDFFKMLESSKNMPHTSLINEYRWTEVFEEATKNGDEAIVITMSSKLSGTYKCAEQAASNFNGKVHVIDSLNVTLCERLLAYYALKLIKKEKTILEIVEILNKKKTKLRLFAMMDTLKYLKKGGRISAVAALLGELLFIKPIVAIIAGEVKVLSREKGMKKVNQALANQVEKCGGIDFTMPYATIWSGSNNSNLKKFIEEKNYLWKDHSSTIEEYMLGSTIGTHIGPNAFGIAFFEN